MTIRTRLERLEANRPPHDDLQLVMFSLAGTNDHDVIGIRDGSEVIARQPAESLDELQVRARPMLATPWAGMPMIMSYAYSDEAHARVRAAAQ